MTTSEALNALVGKMAEKDAYAYTAGYLQSFLMQVIAQTSKKDQALTHSDIFYHLNKLGE